jgi:two-component system OmpR family response regulator
VNSDSDNSLLQILLVDDEPDLREPLASYLERQGFGVRQAASAAEARASSPMMCPIWFCSTS